MSDSATDNCCRNDNRDVNYYNKFRYHDYDSCSNDNGRTHNNNGRTNNYNGGTNNSSCTSNNYYSINDNNGGANNDNCPADNGSCDDYLSDWYIYHPARKHNCETVECD